MMNLELNSIIIYVTLISPLDTYSFSFIDFVSVNKNQVLF